MPALRFQPQARRYYEQGYWRDGDLWRDFERHAAAVPEKPALLFGERSISYAELRGAAAGLSARLAGGGVGPGDVVILIGRNSVEAAVALLACLHRGAVAAPLPSMFGEAQLGALIEQTGARALVCFGGEAEIARRQGFAERVPLFVALRPADLANGDAAPTGIGADDPAVVMHSSGSTAAPKGILHSSNTLRYAASGVCRRWRLDGDDVTLVLCEWGFVGSLVFGYLIALLRGGTAVLIERWDPALALREIERRRCTYAMFVPTHATDLVECEGAGERDISSLRVLAAPSLAPAGRARMKEVFGRVPLGDYGMTEVPGHAAHRPEDSEALLLSTDGPPFEGTEIRVLDEDGARLPAGATGSVVVNGPSRLLGFLGNDELTRESLTEWGGYETGDIGRVDEHGHFTYVGRSKDVIRRGSVTVVPAELERVLLRHPEVREVAVVPLPDERLGERVCAAVIPASSGAAPTVEQLAEFLAGEGVAKYMWPESVESFDEFPRTPSLKAVKRQVVELIAARHQP